MQQEHFSRESVSNTVFQPEAFTQHACKQTPQCCIMQAVGDGEDVKDVVTY